MRAGRMFLTCFATIIALPAHAQMLVPAPLDDMRHEGVLRVTDRTLIVASPRDRDAVETAAYLADPLKQTRKLDLKTAATGSGPRIEFVRERASGPEGYRLTVSPTGLRIAAGTRAGFLYGAVSAWQLLTEDGGVGPATVGAVQITDAPRFKWRGVMIDSSRHFQSPEFIMRLIDLMALHKLNTLHGHLVDDQGWRLEIKRFPRLTEIGAWRNDLPGTAGTQGGHLQRPTDLTGYWA